MIFLCINRLNYITWDKDTYGWGVVDLVLLKLRQGTNMRVRMANLLRGRRILLVDSTNSAPVGWALVDLASLLFGILPTTTVDIIDDPAKLNKTVSNAASNVAPYDIILMVYDKEATFKEIESINTPVGIIRSNCRGCQRGILALQGQGKVLPLVIKDKEDAAEELFSFFEKSKAMHGDKTDRLSRGRSRASINMQPFL